MRTIVAGAILSAACLSCAAQSQTPHVYKENSENWYVTSAWVKEVSRAEQSAAIMLGFNALNQKMMSVLQSGRDNDKDHMTWSLKIKACGSKMLSRVSTKNEALAKHLAAISELYLQLINAEISLKEFAAREEASKRSGEAAIREVDEDALTKTLTRYRDRVKATETSLVVYSMECASRESGTWTIPAVFAR